MSTVKKGVIGGLLIYMVGLIVLGVVFGSSGANDEFLPQNEFRLDSWFEIAGPIVFNKAVLYLLLAALLTVGTMLFIANRMQAKPNRWQTAVEFLYVQMRNITKSGMDDAMARKWFPLIGALFLFIWFSNMIGYIPLPLNTEHKTDIFGLEIPSFALYAATANVSIPLVLALIVFVSYTVEGFRAKGFAGYMKSFVPAGITGVAAVPMFVLEGLSNLMRLVSLTVRLFANLLAGHLIILFMSGGLAVLLGTTAVGWLTLPFGIAIFLFEVGLIATLQAFIFATLSAIYLGGAVADDH